MDFAREIQPILSENCYHCHGPDAKSREAKLRLDTKDGAYRTLDGVTVVKPRDCANSDLIVRVFSSDKDDVMPPPKSNRHLNDAQKQLLKRWVERRGAMGRALGIRCTEEVKGAGFSGIRGSSCGMG